MKKLLLCLIAIAMSIGFALTPASAVEIDQGFDPHYPYMWVDPGGIGDLLLFSLYDVRPVDGRGPFWENYIAIENTSGKWTAFHLRFRAWKKSIEVYDHVILLSPYDVFWMTLSLASEVGDTTYPCDDAQECPNGFERYEAGDVLMYSGDLETLYNSGLIYEKLSQTYWLDKFQDSLLVFNGFDSGPDGSAPKSEMQAGYIEAIGLWQLSIPSGDEDTHELSEVVTDVHPDPVVGGVDLAGTININDALDALMYRFLTPDGFDEVSRDTTQPGQGGQAPRFACTSTSSYTGCWSQYPINKVKSNAVDSAWPDFVPLAIGETNEGGNFPVNAKLDLLYVPVKIERVTQANYNGALVYVAESPTATRLGEDCGNVLTGNVVMGDAGNGKYQMENFIALKNFRTDVYGYDGAGPLWSHIYYTTGYGPYGNNCPDLNDLPLWLHRDGYMGGGIYFPASITDWYYKPGAVSKFTGGSAETYFWYYVNPSVTTAAGPMLVDGNDLSGFNFNDVQGDYATNNPEAGYYTDGSWEFYNFNRMLRNYGLTRPFPANTAMIENNAWAFVHYINDIWSLDDLEMALAKFEIWYTHLRTRMSDGQKGNLDTDVVMTYPTKHNHFFFTDWPFMWQPFKQDYCPADLTTLAQRVTGADVDAYWANLIQYRGDRILDYSALYTQGLWGAKSIEQLLNFATETLDYFAEEAIMPQYNNVTYDSSTHSYLTMAQWFASKWANGKIFLDAYIWDNDQNMPEGGKELPPPGSPWVPDPGAKRWAPHEVNIARAGESGAWPGDLPPGTIRDLDWLLSDAYGTQFGKGQFLITPSYLFKGQRILWDWARDLDEAFVEDTNTFEPHMIYQGSTYLIPPIGLVIYNHDFGDSEEGITRSAMAEWHYKPYWIWLYPDKYNWID